MALGIVADADFEAQVIDLARKGRGSVKQVPTALRKLIAEESINGAPAKELSDVFGISPSSISAYKNGATSTASYNQPDTELSKHVNDVRSDIGDKARARLLSAIEAITPEKIEAAKLRDIASVAKDMSAVIKNMEPEGEERAKTNNFIFFSPNQKEETAYKVIDVQI